ncbi:MAG: DUF5309 family protein [Pseudomonadota bacterium]
MAVPANTLQTYQSTNNAEDVSDIINNVSPFDTPLYTLAKKTKADATYTEWLVEALEAVDTANANIEGDDATIDVSTTPTRVGNYTQLLDKTLQISTTQQAIRKYGVSDEWAHQKVKKGRAIKNDFEAIMLLNQARVVGAAGTAQKMRSLPAWYVTNVSRGAGGANGSATTAATDGTQRNFTEALFKAPIIAVATNANEMPTVVMAGITQRANLSSQLTGNTTKFKDMMDGKLNASITVYRSDYGDLKLVPNRRQRERDLHYINPDYIGVRTLEPMQFIELGRSGLSRSAQMWLHATLEVSNEAAHAVLADLNTTVL